MARELSRTTERPVAARQVESDPLRDMIGLRDTINGMFEDFFSGRPLLASTFGEPAYGALGYEERGWMPPVDIVDSGEELVVYAGLTGIKKEDCSIEVKDGTLVLSGECKEASGEGKTLLRHELACGKFYRAFSLPVEVKSEAVKATYRDGLLEIHLPKAEGAKARRVEIQ